MQNPEMKARFVRALRSMADEIDAGTLDVVESFVENEMQETAGSQLGLTMGRVMEPSGFQKMTLRLFRPANAPKPDPRLVEMSGTKFHGER